MDCESEPISTTELVAGVESEAEQNTKTEAKESGKQPTDENQPKPTNSADQAVEKHDNLEETQAKAASTSKWKLKSDRKKWPFSPFSVALLLRLALVFGSFAGSLALSQAESTNLNTVDFLGQLQSVPRHLSGLESPQYKASDDANATTIDVLGLLRIVSQLGGVVDNLQIKIQNIYLKSQASKLRKLRGEMTAIQMDCIENYAAVYVGGICYLSYGQVSNFSTAKSFCESKGGMVAIVDKDEILKGLFKNDTSSYWIGHQDLSTINRGIGDNCHGVLRKWLDGRNVTYFNWRSNSPSCVNNNLDKSNRVLENCVEANKDGMDDIACMLERPFYCQFR